MNTFPPPIVEEEDEVVTLGFEGIHLNEQHTLDIIEDCARN